MKLHAPTCGVHPAVTMFALVWSTTTEVVAPLWHPATCEHVNPPLSRNGFVPAIVRSCATALLWHPAHATLLAPCPRTAYSPPAWSLTFDCVVPSHVQLFTSTTPTFVFAVVEWHTSHVMSGVPSLHVTLTPPWHADSVQFGEVHVNVFSAVAPAACCTCIVPSACSVRSATVAPSVVTV